MRAERDFRRRIRAGGEVTLTMTLSEFREHVEWLELLAPDDGATRDLREQLDRIDPPAPPEGANIVDLPDQGVPSCG